MIVTLYGKNEYIRNKIVNKKLHHTTELNLHILEAPNLEQLVNLINSKPIFSTKRTIVVKSLKNLSDSKTTIKAIENKSNTTHLIFNIFDFSDKKQIKKWLSKTGSYQEVKLFKSKDAEKYLQNLLKSANVAFAKNSDHYFLFLTGLNPEIIDLEFSNIIENNKDIKVITNPIIARAVTRRTDLEIFKLLDTIFKDNIEKGVSLITQFIDNDNTKIIQLINMLLWKLRLAIILKNSNKINEIAINPYLATNIKNQVKKYSLVTLVEFYTEIINIKYGIWIGQQPMPKLYLAFHKFKTNNL